MAEVYPEYRVRLERVQPGDRAVEADYPDNPGKRTKLGGEPIWIQAEEVPNCPHCQRPMSFIAEIDSIDHDGHGGSGPYMFGDVGMIYVFYCNDCGEVKAILQYY